MSGEFYLRSAKRFRFRVSETEHVESPGNMKPVTVDGKYRSLCENYPNLICSERQPAAESKPTKKSASASSAAGS